MTRPGTGAYSRGKSGRIAGVRVTPSVEDERTEVEDAV